MDHNGTINSKDLEIQDSICPICGKNYIPAPFHNYKIHGKKVCSWHCQLKGERDRFVPQKGESALKKVLMFDLDGNFLREYRCAKDAGESLGIRPETIRLCCRGKKQNAGGFAFCYKTEEEEK